MEQLEHGAHLAAEISKACEDYLLNGVSDSSTPLFCKRIEHWVGAHLDDFEAGLLRVLLECCPEGVLRLLRLLRLLRRLHGLRKSGGRGALGGGREGFRSPAFVG